MSKIGRLVLASAIGAAFVAFGPADSAAAATSTLDRLSPGVAAYPSNPAGFSVAGNVTATGKMIDVAIPPPPATGATSSGCDAADFAGFPAGSIAIMQRGLCTFEVKAANAQAAGAVAAVIFNEGQPGRTDVFTGTLGGPGITIPVVFTSFAVGFELSTMINPVLKVTVTDDAALCASPPVTGTAVGTKNVIVATPGTITTGTASADVIYGTAGIDRIQGLGGDDLVFGLGGNDQVSGGEGHDTLCGGDNDDSLSGDAGNDSLNGDAGNDTLLGGTGDDTLVGGAGTNRSVGGDGTDACVGVVPPSQAVQCEGSGN